MPYSNIKYATKTAYSGEFGATDQHNSEIKDMSVRLKLTVLNS